MMKITQTIVSDDHKSRTEPIDYFSITSDNDMEIVATLLEMMKDSRKGYDHSETVSIRIDFV